MRLSEYLRIASISDGKRCPNPDCSAVADHDSTGEYGKDLVFICFRCCVSWNAAEYERKLPEDASSVDWLN